MVCGMTCPLNTLLVYGIKVYIYNLQKVYETIILCLPIVLYTNLSHQRVVVSCILI